MAIILHLFPREYYNIVHAIILECLRSLGLYMIENGFLYLNYYLKLAGDNNSNFNVLDFVLETGSYSYAYEILYFMHFENT